MSDITTNKAQNNLKMGLTAFGDGIKKLLVIGIIIPLLLTIPSLFMQSRWIKYDKILDKHISSTYSEDPYSEFTEEEYQFIEDMEYGGETYQLQTSIGFAFFILCAFLIALCIGDLMKNIYGAQAEMTFAVPCKKTVLFAAKFLSSTLVIGFAFILLQIQTHLMDDGLIWRNGKLYLIENSYYMEWANDMSKLVRSYEPFKLTGFAFPFLLVIVAWRGLAFLLSLAGKLQKRFSTVPCAIILVITTIVLFFASVAAILYGESYENKFLMILAPAVLFLSDLLMIADYDRVSS